MKPKEDWVYIQVEPIVSEELWDKCNQILDEQQKKNKRPAKKAVHLFTGYAFCGCGSKMYVPSNSPKYTCYDCRNKISTGDLEDLFHSQLKSFFFSPTEITSYLNEADKVIKEKEELLRTLADEMKKVEQEKEKVYKAYINDELDVRAFGSRNRPLEERMRQIEAQIPEVQGEIDFLRIQFLSSDQILNDARDLYSRWPQLTSEEKRQVVENITEKIDIVKNEVTIHLCYLPSSLELVADKQRNLRGSWPQRA